MQQPQYWLQFAALATSALFLSVLAVQGGHVFTLTNKTYFWAVIGGICIGAAEIGYLYLLGGLGGVKPMAANIAIPSIVCGTIVIAMLFSYVIPREDFHWNHALGSFLILVGVICLFIKKDSLGH